MKLQSYVPLTDTLRVSDMKAGDTAILLDGNYAGQVVAMFGEKTFIVLVSLTNGKDFWTAPSKVDYKVRLLPKGTILTLEV